MYVVVCVPCIWLARLSNVSVGAMDLSMDSEGGPACHEKGRGGLVYEGHDHTQSR